MTHQHRDPITANPRPRHDLEELRRELQKRVDQLVNHLYGADATLSGHEWRVSAATGGKGTSCAISRRGSKAGCWYDHDPGAEYRSGGIIDLISVVKNLSIADAIEWAASWLNRPPDDHGRRGFRIQPKESRQKEVAQAAGTENLARLESNLRRHHAALQYLHDRGLTTETILKFHLGLKEPYRRKSDGKTVSNALCYPLISSAGEPLNRYGCYNIPGVTENPVDKNGWGRGSPSTYYSGPVSKKGILFVAEGCKDLWILDQCLAGTPLENDIIIVSSSHGSGIPDEWKDAHFWSPWSAVYFGHDNDKAGEQIARTLIRFCGREVYRVRVPEGMGKDWTDFFKGGGTAAQFGSLLENAPTVSDPAPEREGGKDKVGEFAAQPMNINGAFVNGHLYYPFTVERRELERVESRDGARTERVVTSYVTKVLRSDGAVLDVVRLPAPKGTSYEKRVLALTDGTRVEKEPQPSYYATWQLDSLQLFIRSLQSSRPAPHRPLSALLTEVSEHLRRSVWLPYEEDYAVLALYVAMSFVFQVFDAIPLVIISGEKGTGKSELGDAIARVSFNATIVGQGSAASIVRLLNEARGLVVLDDLEAVGRSLDDASFSDINQMLKLSYKKRTGRKAITDKNGKTTIFDFFGPKIINNTQGVDSILGSRMIYIQTRKMPQAAREEAKVTGSDADELINLRNELHVWGMASARQVHEHYRRLMDAKGDRDDEISAPLRAIAELSGDQTIREQLEAGLRHQPARRTDADDPVEILKEAVNSCIRQGAVKELSGAQLSLELRLLADHYLARDWTTQVPVWQQAEWMGHQLRNLEIRDIHSKVSRVRLYGIVTRVYELRAGYVKETLEDLSAAGKGPPTPKGSLDFCEQTPCEACPYNHVCSDTVIGLKNAKMLNRGKSGRKNLGRL